MGIENPAVLDAPELERAIASLHQGAGRRRGQRARRAALGLAYAINGDGAKAIETLKPLDAEWADLSLYWIARFYWLVTHTSPEAGQAVLLEAVAVDPGFLLARSYQGELFSALGKHDAAQKVWEDYLKLAPAEPFVQARLAKALARQGPARQGHRRDESGAGAGGDQPRAAAAAGEPATWTRAADRRATCWKGSPSRPRSAPRRWCVTATCWRSSAARHRAGGAAARSGSERRRPVTGARGRAHYDLALVAAKAWRPGRSAGLARPRLAGGLPPPEARVAPQPAARGAGDGGAQARAGKRPPALAPTLLPKEATLCPLGSDDVVEVSRPQSRSASMGSTSPSARSRLRAVDGLRGRVRAQLGDSVLSVDASDLETYGRDWTKVFRAEGAYLAAPRSTASGRC